MNKAGEKEEYKFCYVNLFINILFLISPSMKLNESEIFIYLVHFPFIKRQGQQSVVMTIAAPHFSDAFYLILKS